MVSAGKLRMATDSLIHVKDALWSQYYKVIREDLRVMGNIAQQDQAGMRRAYASLSEHYELIRPSVVIQRKPEDVNMMESWISYAGVWCHRGHGTGAKVVSQGEEMINSLFGKKKDEPAPAPLGEVKEPWTWRWSSVHSFWRH